MCGVSYKSTRQFLYLENGRKVRDQYSKVVARGDLELCEWSLLASISS